MGRVNKAKLGLTQGVPEAPSEKLEPHEIRAEMYRQCFDTAAGEYVRQDLKFAFGDRNSFVPDSNVTAFHEGQRDVHRLIEALITQASNRDAAKDKTTP